MSIKISAIIPTHKRHELLRRAIDSVINQSEKIDEIIIVDDAFCHMTKSTVESYNLDYMKYLNSTDSGAASSRNYGVSVARSEFVAFLDDDDEWVVDKIENQKRMIINENLDACFSRILIVYEGTKIKYTTKSTMPERPNEEICIENFVGGTISAVMKRDVFISLNGFDKNFEAREEYDLWIRLFHSGARIGILEQPLSVAYRSFNNRVRISSNIEKYENAIKLLNSKHCKLVNETLSASQISLRYRRQYEFLAAQAITVGLRFVAVRYYIRASRCKFNIKFVILAFISFVSPLLLIRFRAMKG